MSLVDTMQKLVRPVANRVQNLVQRAVLKRVDDTLKMQAVQVLAAAGAVRSGVERFQQYGFTSVPQEGAEAVMLSVGGLGDHGIVIVADDRRYRLKGLEAGEVALYTDEGDSIVMKRGGTIEVTGATEVKVIAPKITLGNDSDAAAMASKVDAQLSEIRDLLKTWVVVPSDGGAALKAAALLKWPAGSASTASAVVKAKA